MSGYIGEPELMAPTWRGHDYAPFDKTSDDIKLASKLLDNSFGTEAERAEAITRLCEVAAVSGDICIRANLALAGGINTSRFDLFQGAIGVELDEPMDVLAEIELLRIADKARRDGNEESYELICASIGLYPALEPFDRADPRYKHEFSHDSTVVFDRMNNARAALAL